MLKTIERERGRRDAVPGTSRGGNNNVRDIGEKRALDGVGEVLGQLGGVDVLGAEGRELLDGFEDLIGQLAGGDEDEGGGELRWVGLWIVSQSALALAGHR
jgi:hypothetical protein